MRHAITTFQPIPQEIQHKFLTYLDVADKENIIQHFDEFKILINLSRDQYGQYPIHICCILGDIKLVQLLIDNGADVNVFDFECYSPLHRCIRSNSFEIAKLLIENNIDVNSVTHKGMNAFHYLCRVKSNDDEKIELCELLFDNNCDINVLDSNGTSPLDNARLCPVPSPEFIGYLLEKGAKDSV